MTKAVNKKGTWNTPNARLLQICVHCSLAQSPDSDTQVLDLRLWILPTCHRNISSSSIILVEAHGSRPRSTPDGQCGFEGRGTTTWSSNIIVERPYTQIMWNTLKFSEASVIRPTTLAKNMSFGCSLTRSRRASLLGIICECIPEVKTCNTS